MCDFTVLIFMADTIVLFYIFSDHVMVICVRQVPCITNYVFLYLVCVCVNLLSQLLTCSLVHYELLLYNASIAALRSKI